MGGQTDRQTVGRQSSGTRLQPCPAQGHATSSVLVLPHAPGLWLQRMTWEQLTPGHPGCLLCVSCQAPGCLRQQYTLLTLQPDSPWVHNALPKCACTLGEPGLQPGGTPLQAHVCAQCGCWEPGGPGSVQGEPLAGPCQQPAAPTRHPLPESPGGSIGKPSGGAFSAVPSRVGGMWE